MRRVKEAQILLGFAAPSYADENFTGTHLLSAMLGGGMASRLFQELREAREDVERARLTPAYRVRRKVVTTLEASPAGRGTLDVYRRARGRSRG